jgi:uncharacterized membrane protein required for colicin V production
MADVLVDSTLAVIIFGSLYEGYRRGLIASLLGLAGFTTVLLLCLSFGESLSKPLKPVVPLPTTYAMLASYIAICFAIALIAYFLNGFFTKLMPKKLPPAVDAVGGMFVGFLRGAVFTVLCLVILMLMANPMVNEKIVEDSRIGAAIFRKVGKVSPTVNEIFTEQPSPVANNRVLKQKSDYETALDSFKKKSDDKKGKR